MRRTRLHSGKIGGALYFNEGTFLNSPGGNAHVARSAPMPRRRYRYEAADSKTYALHFVSLLQIPGGSVFDKMGYASDR